MSFDFLGLWRWKFLSLFSSFCWKKKRQPVGVFFVRKNQSPETSLPQKTAGVIEYIMNTIRTIEPSKKEGFQPVFFAGFLTVDTNLEYTKSILVCQKIPRSHRHSFLSDWNTTRHHLISGKLTLLAGLFPCSIGNTSSSSGPFSIAMLVYRSVNFGLSPLPGCQWQMKV